MQTWELVDAGLVARLPRPVRAQPKPTFVFVRLLTDIYVRATPSFYLSSLKLKAIHRFSSTADAVEDLTQLQDGKLSKVLSKFLVDEITGSKKGKGVEETLIVGDTKLGGAIAKKLGIKVMSDSTTLDLYRGIREQLTSLLKGLDPKDLATMSLGLSHSLSRYVHTHESPSSCERGAAGCCGGCKEG